MSEQEALPGKLMVLAGPTAVGKGTVVRYIVEHYPQIEVSISATTRAPRPGEVHGLSYYFLSPEEFAELLDRGELLESAVVHGIHSYGTPRAAVLEKLSQGINVILEIDVQGAFQVRERFPEAILVFLKPPSWEELQKRLVGRGTEDSDERNRRLATAQAELAVADQFDFQIINDTVAQAAADIVQLFKLN